MLAAEREKVLIVRNTGRIPHEVVEDVLKALDVEESMIDARNVRRAELRDGEVVSGRVGITTFCDHLRAAPADTRPNVEGVCEDCVVEGVDTWVHLRMCLTCGHVGCCDSSPRTHATAHFVATGHPVMRSAEPGEEWRWCFVDSRLG